MKPSVLIVNYNGGRQLSDCLRSLEQQTFRDFDIVIVDNASHDDSLDRIPMTMQPTIVRLNRNVGFAEGNNIAAKHATGDPLVLLNPDTLPDPHWLEELLRTMQLRNATAAVSKLVFASNPRIINSSGLQLLRDGRGADAGFEAFDDGQFEIEREVFAGCGAALAIRREAYFLDATLFLYYEDLDAGWRLRASGGSVWYSPRSLVLHAVGASEASPTHRYYVERNRVLTSIRRGDPALAIYSILLLTLKVPQAIGKYLLGNLPRRTAFAVPRAWCAAMIRLPSLMAERYLNRSWRVR